MHTFNVDGTNLAIIANGMSLGVWKFTHGHLRLELLALGRASLHLDVEVPLLVLLLNLDRGSYSQHVEKSQLKINIVERSDGPTPPEGRR